LANFRPAYACGIYLWGLALTLIVFGAGGALAQQALEVPMPQPQSTQRLRPPTYPTAPPPTPPSNNVQTIPEVPSPSPPAPPAAQPEAELPWAAAAPQPEPVLPAVFRGCWRGVVEEVDQMQRLPSASHLGPWMRKTYRLCYRRLGNGPFQATFTEAGVEGRRIINSSGRLNLLSTDGRSYAKMRGYLHFDEFSDSAAPVWWGTSTFAVDEVTDLQCTIEPDGIHATGVVYGERDGEPWFRAWWHTTFLHLARLSE